MGVLRDETRGYSLVAVITKLSLEVGTYSTTPPDVFVHSGGG